MFINTSELFTEIRKFSKTITKTTYNDIKVYEKKCQLFSIKVNV